MPYCNNNGVNIYYEISGQGPPMVLIHPNAFDHNFWMYQIAHFSTWFRVITPDVRGYGRSDKVETEFSLKDLCDDIMSVLRNENVESAILGGCSMGSGVSILLGLDYPDLFKALIIVGGKSGVSRRFRKRIEGYSKIGLTTYHIKHLKQCVTAGFSDGKLGRYLLQTFTERQPRLSGKAIGQVFRAGNTTDTTPRLHTMRVPTLVVNGEFDQSLQDGQKTASLVPNAVHKILPGVGHTGCIEDPAGFDALVIEFLSSLGLLPDI